MNYSEAFSLPICQKMKYRKKCCKTRTPDEALQVAFRYEQGKRRQMNNFAVISALQADKQTSIAKEVYLINCQSNTGKRKHNYNIGFQKIFDNKNVKDFGEIEAKSINQYALQTE